MGRIADKVLKKKVEAFSLSSYQTNRASDIGHPCLRYLVLCRTRWQEAQKPPEGKIILFAEGEKQEREVLRDLEDAGFKIIHQQRPLFSRELNLIGHVDGVIQDADHLIPIEIKAVNPTTFSRIEDFHTLLTARNWWEKKWAWQIQAYLLLGEFSKGVLLLKNKLTGEIKDIEIPRDEEMIELIRKKCFLIEEYVKEEQLPEPDEDLDERVCHDCPFNHICTRDIVRDTSTYFWEEEEVIELLEEREKLKEAHERYLEVDKRLTEIFQGVEMAICGDWVITGRWVDRKGYEVKPGRYWRKKIMRLQKEG